MKLSASNISWDLRQDETVLRYMAEHDFTGLEIAPTRIIENRPYDYPETAKKYADHIQTEYGLQICSMQSIWYGMTQRIAESEENRSLLMEYTQKALQFANGIGCGNVVFGCPRNRSIKETREEMIVEEFLFQCAEAARQYGVVIALEANPPIYQTNFLNETSQVIDLLKRLNHPALKLNLDCGTVLENKETIDWIKDDLDLIHHVHISEPLLVNIKIREIHYTLSELLQGRYQHYISIEMKRQEKIETIFSVMNYIRMVFG